MWRRGGRSGQSASNDAVLRAAQRVPASAARATPMPGDAGDAAFLATETRGSGGATRRAGGAQQLLGVRPPARWRPPAPRARRRGGCCATWPVRTHTVQRLVGVTSAAEMRAASIAARAESGDMTRALPPLARALRRNARRQRRLTECTTGVFGDRRELELLLGRQFVPQVERRVPFALLFIDPGEPLEHRGPVTLRSHETAQLFLGAIHEAGTQVVEPEREVACSRIAGSRWAWRARCGPRPRDRLTAPAHEAAERELDVRFVRTSLRAA